jgi:hypothetical protein
MLTNTDKLLSLPQQDIRERGIGLNFDVMAPQDGFRKDNSLWFGKCTVCMETVSNSLHSKLWEHNIDMEITYHDNGKDILSRKSKKVDYCPLGDIVLD